jgi:hypothetical protein
MGVFSGHNTPVLNHNTRGIGLGDEWPDMAFSALWFDWFPAMVMLVTAQFTVEEYSSSGRLPCSTPPQ